jgi:hypothetical protein
MLLGPEPSNVIIKHVLVGYHSEENNYRPRNKHDLNFTKDALLKIICSGPVWFDSQNKTEPNALHEKIHDRIRKPKEFIEDSKTMKAKFKYQE